MIEPSLEVVVAPALEGSQDAVSAETSEDGLEGLAPGGGPLQAGALVREATHLEGIPLGERANGRKGGRFVGLNDPF